MTASQLQAKRVRFYRRYKKVVSSLQTLLENGVINEKIHDKIKAKWDLQYEIWKEELLEERKPLWKRRGRKKVSVESPSKCTNLRCSRPCAEGFIYCSQACAPYSYLMNDFGMAPNGTWRKRRRAR